jgi:transposase-like protein
MPRKHHTPEEKIQILLDAQSCNSLRRFCRERKISKTAFYEWKSEYFSIPRENPDAKGNAETENQILKLMLSEALLKIHILQKGGTLADPTSD